MLSWCLTIQHPQRSKATVESPGRDLLVYLWDNYVQWVGPCLFRVSPISFTVEALECT